MAGAVKPPAIFQRVNVFPPIHYANSLSLRTFNSTLLLCRYEASVWPAEGTDLKSSPSYLPGRLAMHFQRSCSIPMILSKESHHPRVMLSQLCVNLRNKSILQGLDFFFPSSASPNALFQKSKQKHTSYVGALAGAYAGSCKRFLSSTRCSNFEEICIQNFDRKESAAWNSAYQVTFPAFELRPRKFHFSNGIYAETSHDGLFYRKHAGSPAIRRYPTYLCAAYSRSANPWKPLFGNTSKRTLMLADTGSSPLMRDSKAEARAAEGCKTFSTLANSPRSTPADCEEIDIKASLAFLAKNEEKLAKAVALLSPVEQEKIAMIASKHLVGSDTWSPIKSGSDSSFRSPADYVFDSLDVNKDGHVSQGEFRLWYDSYFMSLPQKGNQLSSSRSTNHCFKLKKEYSVDLKKQKSEKTALKNHHEDLPPNTSSKISENMAFNSPACEVHPITVDQIFLILLRSSIPYIGFGLMDNSLMLLSGEMIERNLGLILGLSTLADQQTFVGIFVIFRVFFPINKKFKNYAIYTILHVFKLNEYSQAAGLGNTVSCATGVVTGGFIERMVYRLGFPSPRLTQAQLDSRVVKNTNLWGSLLGICIGCLLGMFPLLLINRKPRDLEHHMLQGMEDKKKDSVMQMVELD